MRRKKKNYMKPYIENDFKRIYYAIRGCHYSETMCCLFEKELENGHTTSDVRSANESKKTPVAQNH